MMNSNRKGTLNFSLETVLYVIGAVLFFSLIAYFVLSSTHTVSFGFFEKLGNFFSPLTGG